MLSEYGKYDLENIKELSIDYKDRGIVLTNVDQRFYFKTSDYLKDYLTIQTKIKNLSSANMETLAIISYHQPVTRAKLRKLEVSRFLEEPLIHF